MKVKNTRNTKKINLKKKTRTQATKNSKPFKYARKNRRIHKPEHGFVYVGHIPHGFYENEMLSYFSQFGKVVNVRVCRSDRTGKSKGYGFVEFENDEVARIAADTMDNYLMFKKRLEAKFVPGNKMRKLRIKESEPWSIQSYPLKTKREQLVQQRNVNPDDSTHLSQCRKWMNSVHKTLKKLTELGIKYTFQPTDVPSELTDAFGEN